MILPTLMTISAYAKEADGEPLTEAEVSAQADWMIRCKRFMASFNKFAESNLRPTAPEKEPA